MTTQLDARHGLVKVYWHDVHDRVYKVAPQFASIVDILDPGDAFPLYLAYYPYGAIDADTESSFFPRNNGSYYRLSDADVPNDVLQHLGYSMHSTPLGMVLEKEVECFIDLQHENITIPWLIYTPGKIFADDHASRTF